LLRMFVVSVCQPVCLSGTNAPNNPGSALLCRVIRCGLCQITLAFCGYCISLVFIRLASLLVVVVSWQSHNLLSCCSDVDNFCADFFISGSSAAGFYIINVVYIILAAGSRKSPNYNPSSLLAVMIGLQL